MPTDNFFQGMLSCARYAFAPNFYQYCGPDKNKALKDYLEAQAVDGGLFQILADFITLYPYLKFIAWENKISDPFDLRVVEAYWLGNSCLENVKIKNLYQHLLEEQQLVKKYSKKALNLVFGNFSCQARVHHSFHVFNLFRRTGHLPINHTLKTMDNCRIGWGRIIKIQNAKCKMQNYNLKLKIKKPFNHLTIQQFNPTKSAKWRISGASNRTTTVSTQPLIYQNNKLALGQPIQKEILDPFNLAKNLKVGDWVSFHWGFLCEKLTLVQVKNLNFYTNLSLSHL